MEKPVQIVNIMIGDRMMAQHRNLFIALSGMQSKYVICDHSLSAHNFLTNSVNEVYAGKGHR
jgi:Fe-S cluster assembly protein SufD